MAAATPPASLGQSTVACSGYESDADHGGGGAPERLQRAAVEVVGKPFGRIDNEVKRDLVKEKEMTFFEDTASTVGDGVSIITPCLQLRRRQ